MIRNVARGGGKAYKPEVVGLKELEKKLKALRTANPPLIGDMKRLVKESADEVRDQMIRNTISAGWGGVVKRTNKGVVTGADAIASIFSSSRGTEERSRARIAALAGVSKRHSMIEWIAGRITAKSPPTRTPRRVAPGGKVAEALATMLEFGTTVMSARPAIRPAVEMSKAKVISALAEGMNALLVKYSA